MVRSVWFTAVVLIVLCTAIGTAKADSTLFTYTYSSTYYGDPTVVWTTQPMAAVTSLTTVMGSDLASFEVKPGLPPVYYVTLDRTDGSLCECNPGSVGTVFGDSSPNGGIVSLPFALSDYYTPGTYVLTSPNDTFPGALFPGYADTLTVVAVPEPGSAALLPIGLGLLGLMMLKRKLRPAVTS